MPVALSPVDKTKLRLALKVGIFYFQYTQLKHQILVKEQEVLVAPRNHPGHLANEPAESIGDQMVEELARHKQP